MYRSTYLREVRKEKYERSDALDEQSLADFNRLGLSHAQGLEHLQELNERFANYINRARVLEQRNAIFRKQLETFQRMDEISGLEEAFEEQIELNGQRVRELSLDHAKLEREYKDAQRMVDEFRNKYRNECEYQQVLRETLERLNKEADEALLCNLELQIESQFLQDDINATKDRYKKNLMEIQTYVNILQQIIQTTPRVNAITAGTPEEKLMSERKIPVLQNQLEEYKTILCQLQAQKCKLQSETTMLEQAIKNTQESYDDEIQLYNEQIDIIRKGIEEAEHSFEKYTNDCRQLLIYQQSLENELERNKRIIENEDNRLNSAIVGTPITLFTQSYRSSYTQAARGKDITMAIQDIATAKPRQKGLPRKAFRKKDIVSVDTMATDTEGQVYSKCEEGQQIALSYQSHSQKETGQDGITQQDEGAPPEDVPDGAQISKAFNHLCIVVRDRMRGHTKPEHANEYYTKGRYVLVTGEGSYLDPCFYSCSPQAGGGTTVIISNGGIPFGNDILPIPELPEPPEPADQDDNETSSDDEKEKDPEDQGSIEGTDEDKENEQGKKSENKKDEPKKPPDVTRPEPSSHSGAGDQHHDSSGLQGSRKVKYSGREDRRIGMPSRDCNMPGSMSYEKVEVVESIEKFSDDRIEAYEETAMIVETMIEKTSKKKQGDKGS